MLYVYYGTDTNTARAKVQATVAKMLAKHPDALHFRVTPDTLAEHSFPELTQSQGLFKQEYIVVLDMVSEAPDGAQVLSEYVAACAESPHPFFVLEAKLTAPLKKKLEKHAAAMNEFADTKKQPAQAAFNTFSLTDALTARDRTALWALFREAHMRGVADEEIHGILFWMYKTLLLAASADTPEAAGLKPYPFSKAKRALAHFTSTDDIVQRAGAFALLPQYARRRGTPLSIALEHFILTRV